MRIRWKPPLLAVLTLLLLFSAFFVMHLPQVVRTPLRTLQVTGDVWGVRFFPDGKTLAVVSSDKYAKLLDVATWREIRTLAGSGEWIYFSKDARTMYTMGRDDIKCWDLSSWRIMQTLKTGDLPSAISPDRKTVVMRVPKVSALDVWNLASGQVKKTLVLPGRPGYGISASFSPDGGTLAVGSEEGTVSLWDTATWRQLRAWKEPADKVEPVAYSPDGRTLAVGAGAKQVKLLDAATGRERHSLDVGADVPYSLIFSPDGSRLITKGMDNVQTPYGWRWQTNKWDARTGREIATLDDVSSGARIVFSHDGSRFATGWDDATLWDTETGRKLCVFKSEGYKDGPVLDLAFPPDDKFLATGGAYGQVSLWRIPN